MKETMIVNKETAMRLWTSRYGKKTKAIDFAGRTMVKSAYDDRNSAFGWNLDHIYPQAKGGKTADHNLICCHILTNDEKADKICFNANSQSFKVVKVENHYEIVNQSKHNSEVKQPTLFDSAHGIRHLNQLIKASKKQKFFGEILIDLKFVKTSAIFDFIREIFCTENVNVFSKESGYSFFISSGKDHLVVIRNYDVGLKSLIQDLLDKCLLLNTYLSHYIVPMDYLYAFDIYFNVTYSKTADEYYQNVNLKDMISYFENPTNNLYISDLVVENTDAKDDLNNEKLDVNSYALRNSNNKEFGQKTYVKYNYVFTKLAKNLDKEVSRQD